MSYGKPYIMAISGYVHDGWFILRLKDGIDKDYFYHLLSSKLIQDQFASLAAGAVVKNISSDLVKQAYLSIPPRRDQEQIAAAIEALSKETRQLEYIDERKLRSLTALKQAILQTAFEGGLRIYPDTALNQAVP